MQQIQAGNLYNSEMGTSCLAHIFARRRGEVIIYLLKLSTIAFVAERWLRAERARLNDKRAKNYRMWRIDRRGYAFFVVLAHSFSTKKSGRPIRSVSSIRSARLN